MDLLPKGPVCQSCGMPLIHDMKGGGTEMNGGRTTLYCSHCYQGGAFTDPYITLEQMMKKVRETMSGMRAPPEVIEQSVMNIRNLIRWKR